VPLGTTLTRQGLTGSCQHVLVGGTAEMHDRCGWLGEEGGAGTRIMAGVGMHAVAGIEACGICVAGVLRPLETLLYSIGNWLFSVCVCVRGCM